MSTGFSIDKSTGKWSPTSFVANEKYLVSKSTLKGYAREVKEIGSNTASIFCKNDFNEYGLLSCSGIQEFRMNKNNGRFLTAYLIGYWNGDIKSKEGGFLLREGGDTPNMEIGKCSPL